MKELGRRIFLVILIIMAMSNYSMAYGANFYNPDKIEENANKLGYKQGTIKAYKNNMKDNKIPYYKAWPSNPDDIIKEYKYAYDDFDEKYESLIETAYKEGFKIGYNEIIKDERETNEDKKEEKFNYAEILGLTLGEIYGYRDFYDNVKNNWSKAIPSDNKIIDIYNLSQETSDFRQAFLTAFKEQFKGGYQEGYKKANFEPIKISYDEGKKDGEYFGNVLGTTYGAMDYYDGKNLDYTRSIPTTVIIEAEFLLNRDSKEYKEGFLTEFEKSYEENYNKTFRAINVNEHKMSWEDGYNSGKEIGLKSGKTYATKDYMLKLTNDWKRHEPGEGHLLIEYNLTLESERYREGFISGFKKGLSEGYIITFHNLNKEILQNKTTAMTVHIAGGEVFSLDKKMSLEIDKGTYYNPIVVTIDTLSENYRTIDEGFIKASDYYSVNIANKSFEYNKEQPIELKFEYYGKQDGGIYKKVKDNWVYLPSEIGDGFIKTKVKPNSFKEEDNIYCVLVDKGTITLPDIRGHWAKDEINTFLRRGIVSGYSDKTFKPNRNVTRGEFLVMLSKVYDWQITDDIQDAKKFKDFNKFNFYGRVISYAERKEYISGYLDKTFRPNNSISYKEVENIMKKVTNTDKFYWSNYSSRILYEKDYRSKSMNNMNNKITRAEAVYMLYTLNEWKY